jgi:hypothetical protein
VEILKNDILEEQGMPGKSARNGPSMPFRSKTYNKPEERKRATGSTAGIASRLNIQRATANPNAA